MYLVAALLYMTALLASPEEIHAQPGAVCRSTCGILNRCLNRADPEPECDRLMDTYRPPVKMIRLRTEDTSTVAPNTNSRIIEIDCPDGSKVTSCSCITLNSAEVQHRQDAFGTGSVNVNGGCACGWRNVGTSSTSRSRFASVVCIKDAVVVNEDAAAEELTVFV